MAPSIEHLLPFPNIILNTPSKQVKDIRSPETQALCELMLKIASGAQVGKANDTRKMFGLAAPQIGRHVRIIVVDTAATSDGPGGRLEVFINPMVTTLARYPTKGWEGCFSLPGKFALVPRKCGVLLRALTPTGEEIAKVYDDFVARIILHEIDHLDGIGFPARLTEPEMLVVPAARTAEFRLAKKDAEALRQWPRVDPEETKRIIHVCKPWPTVPELALCN